MARLDLSGSSADSKKNIDNFISNGYNCHKTPNVLIGNVPLLKNGRIELDSGLFGTDWYVAMLAFLMNYILSVKDKSAIESTLKASVEGLKFEIVKRTSGAADYTLLGEGVPGEYWYIKKLENYSVEDNVRLIDALRVQAGLDDVFIEYI